MELLLNLAWLALALTALGQWLLSDQRERGSLWLCRWQRLAALACVLLLLFPVISISDDLQAAPIYAEGPVRVQDVLRDSGTHHRNSSFIAHGAMLLCETAKTCEPAMAYAGREVSRAPVVRPVISDELYRRPPPAAFIA